MLNSYILHLDHLCHHLKSSNLKLIFKNANNMIASNKIIILHTVEHSVILRNILNYIFRFNLVCHFSAYFIVISSCLYCILAFSYHFFYIFLL